jgi:hypothetical protein
MGAKYYVVGLVIVVILGLFFTFFPHNTENAEPLIAMSPYVVFEGTVISLSLDGPGSYEDGAVIDSAPQDSAVVRIDRILETGGSYDFNWTALGIEEGREVLLDFKYTARPARIITVVGETIQSGDTVSHQVVPTKITYEDGYFMFRIDGSSHTETVLPGLEVGSRFRTKLWETYEVKVEGYELLS